MRHAVYRTLIGILLLHLVVGAEILQVARATTNAPPSSRIKTRLSRSVQVRHALPAAETTCEAPAAAVALLEVQSEGHSRSRELILLSLFTLVGLTLLAGKLIYSTYKLIKSTHHAKKMMKAAEKEAELNDQSIMCQSTRAQLSLAASLRSFDRSLYANGDDDAQRAQNVEDMIEQFCSNKGTPELIAACVAEEREAEKDRKKARTDVLAALKADATAECRKFANMFDSAHKKSMTKYYVDAIDRVGTNDEVAEEDEMEASDPKAESKERIAEIREAANEANEQMAQVFEAVEGITLKFEITNIETESTKLGKEMESMSSSSSAENSGEGGESSGKGGEGFNGLSIPSPVVLGFMAFSIVLSVATMVVKAYLHHKQVNTIVRMGSRLNDVCEKISQLSNSVVQYIETVRNFRKDVINERERFVSAIQTAMGANSLVSFTKYVRQFLLSMDYILEGRETPFRMFTDENYAGSTSNTNLGHEIKEWCVNYLKVPHDNELKICHFALQFSLPLLPTSLRHSWVPILRETKTDKDGEFITTLLLLKYKHQLAMLLKQYDSLREFAAYRQCDRMRWIMNMEFDYESNIEVKPGDVDLSLIEDTTDRVERLIEDKLALEARVEALENKVFGPEDEEADVTGGTANSGNGHLEADGNGHVEAVQMGHEIDATLNGGDDSSDSNDDTVYLDAVDGSEGPMNPTGVNNVVSVLEALDPPKEPVVQASGPAASGPAVVQPHVEPEPEDPAVLRLLKRRSPPYNADKLYFTRGLFVNPAKGFWNPDADMILVLQDFKLYRIIDGGKLSLNEVEQILMQGAKAEQNSDYIDRLVKRWAKFQGPVYDFAKAKDANQRLTFEAGKRYTDPGELQLQVKLIEQPAKQVFAALQGQSFKFRCPNKPAVYETNVNGPTCGSQWIELLADAQDKVLSTADQEAENHAYEERRQTIQHYNPSPKRGHVQAAQNQAQVQPTAAELEIAKKASITAVLDPIRPIADGGQVFQLHACTAAFYRVFVYEAEKDTEPLVLKDIQVDTKTFDRMFKGKNPCERLTLGKKDVFFTDMFKEYCESRRGKDENVVVYTIIKDDWNLFAASLAKYDAFIHEPSLKSVVANKVDLLTEGKFKVNVVGQQRDDIDPFNDILVPLAKTCQELYSHSVWKTNTHPNDVPFENGKVAVHMVSSHPDWYLQRASSGEKGELYWFAAPFYLLYKKLH